MTRVHQALRRAQTLGTDKPAAPVPIRLAAPSLPAFSKDKPLTAATGELITCPGCDTVQEVRSLPRKSWTRRLRSLFGIQPYRCGSCRRRFSDVDMEEAQLAERHRVEVFSTFLRPEDDRGFEELVEEIAQAERDQNQRDSAPRSIVKNEQTGEQSR